MAINNSQNNFLWYLVILCALFILVFFTKNIFGDIQASLDVKASQETKFSSAESELARLNKIQKDFSSNTSDASKEISKFLQPFDDQALINHIYDYVDKTNTDGTRIALKSVTLSWGEEGDLWFKEANVNVSARFASEATLLAFISYLINEDANYTFFIESLSYPTTWGSFQASIPLKLLYK